MGFKIERGFAKCPAKGCAARKVLFIAVESGKYGTFGVMDSKMVGIIPAGWRGTDVQIAAFKAHGIYCEQHETGMKLQRLNAVRNDDVDCTEKCRNAIGPNCECSCVGSNHGKSAMVSLS